MSNIQPINDQVSIKDWGMVFHMSGAKAHVLKYQGTLMSENEALNEKVLVKETHTPVKGFMEYGIPVVAWYLNGLNTPTFKSFDELFNHYVNPSISQPANHEQV